jgi:PadR family transcriptional regulator, regulatory protein PadR
MAKKPDLGPGTLAMLILKTLTRTPLHGYGSRSRSNAFLTMY